MKYQVLFSLKNNKKVFMNVVCCSCDWLFKGYDISDIVMLMTVELYYNVFSLVDSQR